MGLLCARKTSSSSISSSLTGSGFWVAGSWIQLISAPAEGQRNSYLGLNRVTERQGPSTPEPMELMAQPTPPGIWDGGGGV